MADEKAKDKEKKPSKPAGDKKPAEVKKDKEKAPKAEKPGKADAKKEEAKKEKPAPPPRPPVDPRAKYMKKFSGKFLPKGELRTRHQEILKRWNSGEDHGGVTVEELKNLLEAWRATRQKPAAKA
jgi:hypothetical protein